MALKWLVVSITLIIAFSGCKKEINQPEPIEQEKIDYTYIFHLGPANRIDSIEEFGNTLISNIAFHYGLNQVTLIYQRIGDYTAYDTFYFVNGILTEERSVLYQSPNTTNFYHTLFTYNGDGSLLQDSVEWTRQDRDTVEKNWYTNKYGYDNENMTTWSYTRSNGDYHYTCYDYYYYGNQKAVIDINNFLSFILKNGSKNLCTFRGYQGGCPLGSGYIDAISTYSYEIDPLGYVTKQIEEYTPGHGTYQPIPKSKIIITQYKYVR